MISVTTNQRSVCIGTVCALLLLGAARVSGADISIRPTLAISEEYTDNVFDSSVNKRSDYITRAQPGVSLKYMAPFWDWDLGYAFDYRNYARGSRHDDATHNINGRGLIKIADEVLFLEVSDVYQRVSLDVTRDTTIASLSSENQSDQNVGTVSPYLVLRPTSRLTLKTGYRYINTWYEDESAISRQDHLGFITSSYDLSPTLLLTGDYTFTREISRNNGFYQHEAYLGPRFEYAEKSFIHARGGFIGTDYDNGPHVLNPSWDAGITHTFDTMILNVSTGTRYSADPRDTSTLETSYSASLTKNLPRGSLTLQGSYTEFSDAKADHLENKRNSGGFAGAYELVQDLRATLGLSYEKYRDLLLNGTTDRYFVNCGLNYYFGKELTAAVSYRYINYSSAEIAADNREVNRVMLEVRKVF